MKDIIQNKKRYVLAGVLGLFLLIVGMSHAFSGPTAPPPNGQPLGGFIKPDTDNQFKDGDPTTAEPPFPGDYTLRVTKSSGPNQVGIGTEGLLSWTTDGFSNNLNRAIISYGKLVVDLSGVAGFGKYARTAVKLFTNPDDNLMTNVITNKPILGFWLDSFSGTDRWATGFFGKAALSSLVLGGNTFRTTSYSGGTLKDLDVAGTTNIGRGDVCVIQPEDTCPLGSYLAASQPQYWTGSDWQTYSDGNVNNTTSLAMIIQNDSNITTSSAIAPYPFNGYSRMCKFFDPSPTPTFFGPCSPDPLQVILNPLLDPIENIFGQTNGYNPWYLGGPALTGGNHPQESPQTTPGSSSYTLSYAPWPYGSSIAGTPGPYPYQGFYSDFKLSGPLVKDEKFTVTYVIDVPAYTFTFTPKPNSIPASAVGVPQSITIPASTFTLTETVTKHPNSNDDPNTTFVGNPIPAYVDNAKQTINNFIASFNAPPPNNPNGFLTLNEEDMNFASTPKTKGFLGTPIAYALPTFPANNVSGPLFYWFKEKMKVTKQCIVPESSYITVTPGVNFGGC